MGIFDEIQKGNSYTFQCGLLGYYEINKALGVELTPEQELEYEKALEAQKKALKLKEERFYLRWGEDTVDLHNWLNEKFGNYRDRIGDENYRYWTISSFSDDCDQSETIYLEWKNGQYDLVFSPEDGYAGRVVIKSGLCENYIRNCIENWT